jgi:hypothetical protein
VPSTRPPGESLSEGARQRGPRTASTSASLRTWPRTTRRRAVPTRTVEILGSRGRWGEPSDVGARGVPQLTGKRLHQRASSSSTAAGAR